MHLVMRIALGEDNPIVSLFLWVHMLIDGGQQVTANIRMSSIPSSFPSHGEGYFFEFLVGGKEICEYLLGAFSRQGTYALGQFKLASVSETHVT